MITAEFYRSVNGRLTGFRFQGHAEYADEGYDIICAAVSALSLNTVNSLEELLGEPVDAQVHEDGFLSCRVQHPENDSVQLLLRSLELGIHSIELSYGKQYLSICGPQDLSFQQRSALKPKN